MENLTSEVATWLRDNGASLVGIASVDRFGDMPQGHQPRDFLPGARSVITFGVALLRQALYWEEHLADSELVPPDNRQSHLLSKY